MSQVFGGGEGGDRRVKRRGRLSLNWSARRPHPFGVRVYPLSVLFTGISRRDGAALNLARVPRSTRRQASSGDYEKKTPRENRKSPRDTDIKNKVRHNLDRGTPC